MRVYGIENQLDSVQLDSGQISLENYNLYRRDRFSGQHGGVCVYIKDQINSKRLAELEDPNFEVLWTYTRPTRLPRGVPCVITACVYHPPSLNDNQILDYLFNSLAKVEGLFPGCAVFMAGDFNQLDVKPLMLSFQMKQLIQHPTRGSNILDLVLTNLHKYYEPRSVEILPPFGLSDHKSIVILPKIRQSELPHKRVIVKRDTRPSRKMELGRYLSQVNWSLIENINTCQEKYDFFSRIILTGLNTIMPERAIKVYSNDVPWITTDLKRLITLRQRALSSGKSDLFKFYRNKVNKTRKLCRAKFFASRVNHLKEYKPKMWWSYVKRISGMSSSCSNLQSQLQVDNIDHLPPKDLADLINSTFLAPMESFNPLTSEDLQFLCDPTLNDFSISVVNVTSPTSVLSKLRNLDPSKAPGPDGIPNWILKTYGEIIATPISDIINTSFYEKKIAPRLEESRHHSYPKRKASTRD